VQDRLLIGQAPQNAVEESTSAVRAGGDQRCGERGEHGGSTPRRWRITTMIQAKYFWIRR
jgi:hypothetical protein